MRAVILTKSYKKDKYNVSGWCVVAFDLENKKLVRFVDDRGTGIPKGSLDNKGINEMDEIEVQVIGSLPCAPQTENLLVNTQSFRRIGHYTPGLGKILSMIPPLPDNEPLFMNDTRRKYLSVVQFHHSVEIIKVRRLCSSRYFQRLLCQFENSVGLHQNINITIPEYYDKAEEWSIGDAYVVVTIPKETYIKDGEDYGFFKFVAAKYEIPPTDEENREFIKLINREPLTHEHYIEQALQIKHVPEVEPAVRRIKELAETYRKKYREIFGDQAIPKEEAKLMLIRENERYNKCLREQREKVSLIMGLND